MLLLITVIITSGWKLFSALSATSAVKYKNETAEVTADAEGKKSKTFPRLKYLKELDTLCSDWAFYTFNNGSIEIITHFFKNKNKVISVINTGLMQLYVE